MYVQEFRERLTEAWQFAHENLKKVQLEIKHDVDVGDVRSIKQHPYRVNPVKDAAMAKEVDYMLKHDIIKPSSSS